MIRALFKKILVAYGILTCAVLLVSNLHINKSTNVDLGNSSSVGERGGNWYLFDNFAGFQTKFDATKIADGANSNGQNTSINDGDRISVRPQGFEIFPSTATASTSAGGITSLHTFRKRNGENILMRAYNTNLEYYDTESLEWEIISSTYANGFKFGFADYNINTDLRSYVYYGNSQNNFARWDGVHSTINGAVTAGDPTITVDDAQYFTATGSIVYCGSVVAYSSIAGNVFTLTGTAPVSCADGRGVASAPVEFASNPKGNIYMVADNRLWIAGVTSTPQAAYFSQYGDATVFTTTTLITDNTDQSSGIFNLGEGGGGITALTQDEQAIYLFKRSAIRRATLNDTIYSISSLKPFDGKSQTTGALNSQSTFTSGNENFFITPDNQIMRLARVESVDYPQIAPISEIIKPTVDSISFVSSTGIVFKNKAYFAAKSSISATYNDTVLVFNLANKSWDSPIIGWNVGDFTVYDDGTGEDLYFGDNASPNVYKINTTPQDGEFGFTANWRSKQFNFGLPQSQKIIDSVFIDGYISPSTELTISLLLDEDGYTQSYTTTLSGASSTYIYNSSDFNLFGLNPFGYERFGSNEDLSGKKKFRIYLNKDFTPIPFYNAQIEFASDGLNQQWEVTDFAFNVRQFSQPTKPTLLKSFR